MIYRNDTQCSKTRLGVPLSSLGGGGGGLEKLLISTQQMRGVKWLTKDEGGDLKRCKSGLCNINK